MNKVFSIIAAATITIPSTITLAGEPYESTGCIQTEDSIALNLENNKKITIPASEKSCNSNFLYNTSKDGVTILLAGPNSDELGPNAQNDIYIISKNNANPKHIGSIPVAANPITRDQFKEISQVGGSIFETTYIINNNNIEIKPESLELIFADKQCILKKENSEKCVNISGTYEKPICIKNSNNRKILQNKSLCAELSKEVESR